MPRSFAKTKEEKEEIIEFVSHMLNNLALFLRSDCMSIDLFQSKFHGDVVASFVGKKRPDCYFKELMDLLLVEKVLSIH